MFSFNRLLLVKRDHRITNGSFWKGSSLHTFQGHLPTDKAAHSLIHPGLEHPYGWAPIFSGHSVQGGLVTREESEPVHIESQSTVTSAVTKNNFFQFHCTDGLFITGQAIELCCNTFFYMGKKGIGVLRSSIFKYLLFLNHFFSCQLTRFNCNLS